MKFPKMPKLPTWAWIVLVLVAVWYIFVREGFAENMTKKPAPGPAVVDVAAKKA